MPIIAIGLATGLAVGLYWTTAAPSLTWAHFGADGGDLLAAAATNGVPHPTGYPLYLLCLRAWLAVGHWLDGHWLSPTLDPAGWGNRFSVLAGAGATALTTLTAATLLTDVAQRWVWAALAALAWTVAPLPWSQSLITEVYALHALLVALLGYAALRGWPPWAFGLVLGLTAAHHVTTILLWPAACYWWLHQRVKRPQPWQWVQLLGLVSLVVGVAYGAFVWKIARATIPPPVAWGYPQDVTGLWWLVSGSAYRSYFLDLTWREFAGRLAGVVQLLATQYTPVGLAVILTGVAIWDQHRPTLRTGALVWMLPVSLYAAAYATIDSYVYLLPVVWLMSLWLAQGLAGWAAWLGARVRRADLLLMGMTATGVLLLGLMRLPQLDLRQDHTARDFLAAVAALPEDALVVSIGDAETFALWYGAWGGGGLAEQELVLVNSALYQFGWYRRLMHDVYPTVPEMGADWQALLQANQRVRPIVYIEPPPATDGVFVAENDFWRRVR